MNAPVKVPFLDLSKEFKALEAEWFEQLRETGASGRFILGPNVGAFEQEMAAYLGVKHCIAVANGTDAIILSLRALGVGPGDEVITSPYTFYATAESVSLVGATPVFADIDRKSFNLDPASVRAKITKQTKAIIPVHIFGHPADMTALMQIAHEFGLKVVEDVAQAFGGEHAGRKLGTFGDTGCTSFYPTKVLGCYGDGGLICTDRSDVDAHLRKLRNHGATAPFMHDEYGYNSRLDEVQAALLRIKLRSLDANIARRNQIADAYAERLRGLDLVLPTRPDNGKHAFNLYTLRCPKRRDHLRQVLTDNQIPSSLCYPLGLHLQAVYRHLGYKVGDLPVVDEASTEALSLPVYPDLNEAQIDRVCEVIRQALA